MLKKSTKPQAIELRQLPLQALTQMKQELDGDIEYMSQSIQTLKGLCQLICYNNNKMLSYLLLLLSILVGIQS